MTCTPTSAPVPHQDRALSSLLRNLSGEPVLTKRDLSNEFQSQRHLLTKHVSSTECQPRRHLIKTWPFRQRSNQTPTTGRMSYDTLNWVKLFHMTIRRTRNTTRFFWERSPLTQKNLTFLSTRSWQNFTILLQGQISLTSSQTMWIKIRVHFPADNIGQHCQPPRHRLQPENNGKLHLRPSSTL